MVGPGAIKPKLSPSAVEIVETEEFEKDADVAFKPLERRALYLALAENPLVGMAMKRSPALRELTFFGYVVVYAVSPDLGTVFLLTIDKDDGSSPDEDSDSWKKVKEYVGFLLKGGFLAAGKKLADEVMEILSWLH